MVRRQRSLSPIVKNKSKLKAIRGKMSERGTMCTTPQKNACDYYHNTTSRRSTSKLEHSVSVGMLSDDISDHRRQRHSDRTGRGRSSSISSSSRRSNSHRSSSRSTSISRSSSRSSRRRSISRSSSSSRRRRSSISSSRRLLQPDSDLSSSPSDSSDSSDEKNTRRRSISKSSRRSSISSRSRRRKIGSSSTSGSSRRQQLLKKNNSVDLSETSCTSCLSASGTSLMYTERTSVLIIGGSGRTGIACCNRFSRHESKPIIHLFVQDDSCISDEIQEICESIIEGDATDEDDLSRALRKTKADNVIVCIGNSNDSLEQVDNTIRTESANALVSVMKKRKFKHVRALVLSRLDNSLEDKTSPTGAAGFLSKSFTFNKDKAAKKLRKKFQHVLDDHVGQEKAFGIISKRVTIVRPTTIKDTKKIVGAVQVLANGEEEEYATKSSTFLLSSSGSSKVYYTPRADLASWIVNETCSCIPLGGRIVNITGVRK